MILTPTDDFGFVKKAKTNQKCQFSLSSSDLDSKVVLTLFIVQILMNFVIEISVTKIDLSNKCPIPFVHHQPISIISEKNTRVIAT